MLISLGAVAFAQSNLAVHTVGATGSWANAVGKGDVNFLVGERLRWSLSTSVRVWADARFLIDPDGAPLLQRYRVRKLGVELNRGSTHLLIGRFPVQMGGARLVDGLQLSLAVDGWTLGAWAGLAPDLFTTAPRFRPGFGPVVAYTSTSIRVSLSGDVLFATNPDKDGLVDRVGLLGTARYAPGRAISLDTRWDVELLSVVGGPRLVDGRVGVALRPTDAIRVSGFYNAFSSLQYLHTKALDPELRRFDARILEQGLADRFDDDHRDVFLNHLVGVDGGVRPRGDALAPFVQLSARYRHNPDPKNRFMRATLRAGLLRLAQRVEIGAVGTLRQVDASLQTDVGLQAMVDLGDGCCQLDSRVLALINPARFDGPGWYADLFGDVVADNGLALGLGANAIVEPLDETELGLSGFVRLSFYQRPRG